MKSNLMGFKSFNIRILTNLLLLISTVFFIYSCSTPKSSYLVYVGTYTGNGSDGIYTYRFHPEKGLLSPIGLATKTENPSFIAIDTSSRFLYAVNEVDSFQNQPAGAVSVFAIENETGKLKLLQQISSLGAAPAHLSIDKSGCYLLVANYNGGNVAVFPILKDGKLGQQTSLVQDSGASVNMKRQGSPHAHFVQVTNNNKFAMTADLGIDKVMVNSFDTQTGTLHPTDSGFVKLEPGSGPRHIAFSPSGKQVYVLNELNSTVTMFSFNPETAEMHAGPTISTLQKDFVGENATAEIVMDVKGKFLYASNRGDNSIVQFEVNTNDGSINPIAWIPSGGKTPRNFEIDPSGEWLFAANQSSDNIVLFRIHGPSGKLSKVSEVDGIVSPVCIKFIKEK
ncbi:MAG: lactonase family protein [Bacteroidales bacterium]